MFCIKIPPSYRPKPGNMVGGRDSPHEVFDPCVRWDLGLDRIRSFRVAVVALSRCRHQDGPENQNSKKIVHNSTSV